MTNPSIFQNPKSGSFRLSGTYDIVDEHGAVISTVTDPKLCGCGLSKDKPFCDKSHAQYVSTITTALENARKLATPISQYGVWSMRANEIRKQSLENRIAAGEAMVGVKYGVGLVKSESEEKKYEGIFGFLTDAMEVKGVFTLANYINPGAEAEIVFKLAKDMSSEIALADVSLYVSHVAAGIEVYDSRYVAPGFIGDAIADNASAGAFAVGPWVDARDMDLSSATIEIYEGGSLNQSVPGTAIGGNPWTAVTRISKLVEAAGVTLPAGSFIFSGSATSGLPMKAGEYRVEISGLGAVSFTAQ